MNQFSANRKLFSEKDIATVQQQHVLLVGAGGLGGYVANGLIRFGVKRMTIVDMDKYDISNLNRQLFSSHDTIGLYKANVLKNACLRIYPEALIKTHLKPIEMIEETLKNEAFDYIIDAVDSISTRLYLEQLTSKLDIPLVHGAVGGWYGQLGIVMPNSSLLSRLYSKNKEGLEKTLGSPTFAPAVVGSMMVSEFIKHVINDDAALENNILFIDLQHHDYHFLKMK
ncbi:MAG: ThiF family adenylyltransferase [Bacillota bacterium]